MLALLIFARSAYHQSAPINGECWLSQVDAKSLNSMTGLINLVRRIYSYLYRIVAVGFHVHKHVAISNSRHFAAIYGLALLPRCLRLASDITGTRQKLAIGGVAYTLSERVFHPLNLVPLTGRTAHIIKHFLGLGESFFVIFSCYVILPEPFQFSHSINYDSLNLSFISIWYWTSIFTCCLHL